MPHTTTTVLLRSIRSRTSLAIIALVAMFGLPASGLAQAPTEPASTDPAPDTASSTPSEGRWYMIKGGNVNVRCAPSVSRSYSIGRLNRDTPVVVVDEADGWASVRTFGPAFESIRGLVRGDDRVQRSGDTLMVMGNVPLMAPNVPAENDPDRSWHRLVTLKNGAKLPVHSSFEDGGETWMLVGLPDHATVYINTAFLREANPDEVKRLGPVAAAPVKPKPVAVATTGTDEPKTTEAEVPAIETVEVVAVTETPAEPATDAPEEPAIETTVVVVGTDESAPADTDATDEATEVIAVAAEETEAPVDPLADVTIEQAEEAWEIVKNDPRNDSEIETLQLIYTAIAGRENTSAEAKRLAELRIRQLDLRQQVQERLRRLESMDRRNAVEQGRIRDAQVAIEARAAYDVVGRLNASQVYDGKRLPLLYRIQAPSGGRTLGYVHAMKDMNLTAMLGHLVGIVGTKNYDAGYRLMIVTPKRIDILTANVNEE